MSTIEFTNEEKELLSEKIQDYFAQEMDQELGRFDAEFLLDFFSKEIGPYFYNRALYDAQVIIQSKVETLNDAISEIEKPTTR